MARKSKQAQPAPAAPAEAAPSKSMTGNLDSPNEPIAANAKVVKVEQQTFGNDDVSTTDRLFPDLIEQPPETPPAEPQGPSQPEPPAAPDDAPPPTEQPLPFGPFCRYRMYCTTATGCTVQPLPVVRRVRRRVRRAPATRHAASPQRAECPASSALSLCARAVPSNTLAKAGARNRPHSPIS